MNYAIILSGGIGSRMKSVGCPKQYIEVKGKPIVAYTLEKFERSSEIDRIIVVVSTEWKQKIINIADKYSITKICAYAQPGEQRQGSIFNGLEACMQFSPSKDDIVIIHDAARPLVSVKMIDSCIDAAREFGGCMPALPMTDTVYISKNGHDIEGLIDRNILFAGQSPEAFRLLEYMGIHSLSSQEEINSYRGTSEIAYKHNMAVHIIPGDDNNFKLTTISDLDKFKAICEEDRK